MTIGYSLLRDLSVLGFLTMYQLQGYFSVSEIKYNLEFLQPNCVTDELIL
jgi:hypothetical protein